jgi:NitT/TauT family transport system substrate-binding protein
MKRREILAAALAIGALPARAQSSTKIAYGYSAVTDFASVFVAKEEGFFAKHNLDVDLKFIPINSTIPAAIESGSLQIGGPTPPGLLQSVEGGLDHVVLGGGGVLSKSYTELALVARPGSGIRSAADCVGKKIGVPGIGALLHVVFRQWLKTAGVDPKQVTFVEAPFPSHADLLRGGSVDAVVSGGPFMTRIVDSGGGYVASYFTTFLPEGFPTIVHVARRDWVQKNPAAAAAFQASVREGAAFMVLPHNDSKVRAALAKYLHLPAPAVAKMQISPPGPNVTAKQLDWWVSLLREQQLLRGNIATSNLILK